MVAWNACMLRIFGSINVAVLICFCFLHGGVKAWVAIPCIILALAYSIGSFVKYVADSVRCQK